MKKTLLASAVCLALSSLALQPALAAVAASSSVDGIDLAAAAAATADERVVAELVRAAGQSMAELSELLARASTEVNGEQLSAAAAYLRQHQLVSEEALAVIEARAAELTALDHSNPLVSLKNNEINVHPGVQIGLVAGGLAVLASGGGGGGSGSSDGDDTTEPPTEEQDPAEEQDPVDEPPPANSSVASEGEYTFTGGMDLSGVKAAHERGYTGANAVVVVLDTGVRSSHYDLEGVVDAFYNPFTGSEAEADAQDVDGHGTHVTGIIAAQGNDYMGVGYAPDASILAVRIADDEGNLSLTDTQEADAFRWAREKGADFINNSWGPGITAQEVTAEQVQIIMGNVLSEFRLGAEAGVIYVWSNGNDGEAGTDQPQLYAGLPSLFPELKDNWVAVANVDPDTGELHMSSQPCGDAAEWCLSAPGTNISAPFNTGDDYYATMTGTSMAAPAVTGALAVLKDAFPMLSNEEIVQRLFITADKSGVYANVALYGQGLMDLDAASAPLGQVSVVDSQGRSVALASTRLELGGAFGNSNPLAGVRVLALDAQGAGFARDLGAVVEAGTFEHDLGKAADRLSRQAPRQTGERNGLNLTFTENGTAGQPLDNVVMSFTDEQGRGLRLGMVNDVDLLTGGLNFTGNSQQKVGFAAPYWMSEDDMRASGMQQDIELLGGSLSFTGLSSDDRLGLSAAFSHSLGEHYSGTLEVGQVVGKDGLLGSEAEGAFGFADHSQTRFVGLRGQWQMGSTQLFHSAYLGQTQVSADGLISDLDAVTTSSWSLGAQLNKGDNRYGLLVAQPLKVESAKATLSYVDGYQSGAFTMGSSRINLTPTGRQINTELFFSTHNRAFDEVKVSLLRMDQPGHNAAASAEHALMLSLKRQF